MPWNLFSDTTFMVSIVGIYSAEQQLVFYAQVHTKPQKAKPVYDSYD